VGKAAPRPPLGHVLAHAAAGVDGQRQVQRQLRLALEDRDLLRPAVLGEAKSSRVKPAYNGPVLVSHVHKDVDQLHVHVQSGFLRRQAKDDKASNTEPPASR
jgi:hypothetical protein